MKGQKELNVHVMPAENFGRHLSCWKEGGRKACKKDPIFNEMEADMHNLVPAIGELNADRSNYKFAALNDFAQNIEQSPQNS